MISEVFQEIDSTNKYLKEKVKNGEAGINHSVLAFSQTCGRGRLGRQFASPFGGLYMSVVLPMESSMTLTAKAAVAVVSAIREVCNIETSIKWVNDIYLNGKKVCGILAEGMQNYVVLGIGVNYCTRTKDIPHELRDIAVSLYDGNQNVPDAVFFAEKIISNIIELSSTDSNDWKKEYQTNSILLGKNVNIIKAGQITGCGIVSSIDENCALHVKTQNGETVLNTGEVSIRFAN